jgi:hypothetical protein
MNSLLLCCTILLFVTSSCESRRRQDELEKKALQLNQKEKELLFKEKSLQLKEQELLKREAKIDSSMKLDTAQLYNPALVGSWSVKMTCIQTTCIGSAVGDTKNEVWNLSYNRNTIVAKAMQGDNLARIYSGSYTGNTIELSETSDSTISRPAIKMIVRINSINENTMEGQREIVRENECKVIYALQMTRK